MQSFSILYKIELSNSCVFLTKLSMRNIKWILDMASIIWFSVISLRLGTAIFSLLEQPRPCICSLVCGLQLDQKKREHLSAYWSGPWENWWGQRVIPIWHQVIIISAGSAAGGKQETFGMVSRGWVWVTALGCLLRSGETLHGSCRVRWHLTRCVGHLWNSLPGSTCFQLVTTAIVLP